MATRDSSGALLVITSSYTIGDTTTAIPEPSDWAAETDYDEADQVKIGSGQTAVYARCQRDHRSATGGLTGTGGTLGGTQSSNWLQVPGAGNVAQLSDTLSFTKGGATTTFRKANLPGTSTFSAVREDTISFDIYEDADEEIQKALVMDSSFTCSFYTQGRSTASGDKRPVKTATVRVTGDGGGFTFGAPTRRSITCAVQGQITDSVDERS